MTENDCTEIVSAQIVSALIKTLHFLKQIWDVDAMVNPDYKIPMGNEQMIYHEYIQYLFVLFRFMRLFPCIWHNHKTSRGTLSLHLKNRMNSRLILSCNGLYVVRQLRVQSNIIYFQGKHLSWYLESSKKSIKHFFIMLMTIQNNPLHALFVQGHKVTLKFRLCWIQNETHQYWLYRTCPWLLFN